MTLREHIIEARRAYLYIDRNPVRLHTTHTALVEDTHDTDEGGLGPPFTADMHRYLQSSRDGLLHRPRVLERPAMASIYEVADWCRANHMTHEGTGFRGSRCAQLVFEVVVFGSEPEDVAWKQGWTLERTERTLLRALEHANRWRRDTLHRLTRDIGIGAPSPEPKPYAA